MLMSFLSILFIGDSLSVETGKSFKEITKPAIVSVESKVGSGLNNRLFWNWYTKAEELNSKYNPDIVIVMLGSNDAPCSAYYDKVNELKSKFPNKKVYWVSVLPFAHSFLWKRTEKNNYVIQKAMGDNFIDVSDVISLRNKFTSKKNGDRIRTEDGVHLTKIGGELIAAEILNQLKLKGEL